MNRREDLYAPALSGILLFLAFPPFGLVLAPFVALIPWISSLARQPPGAAGRWRAARGGFLLGVVANGLLLHWLLVALWPDPWALPAFTATVLVLALVPATVSWAVHVTRERLHVSHWLLVPVFWTAGEWLLAQPWSLSFPWSGLGTALANHPFPASAAELAGTRGLTFVLVAVNGLLASAMTERRGRRLVPVAGAVAIVMALIGFGAWRHRTLELEPVARVAALQTVLARDVKHDRRMTRDANFVTLETMTDSIAGLGAVLIVWPEVAVPVVLDDPLVKPRADRLRAIAERAGAALVVGAYATTAGPPAPERPSAAGYDSPVHNAAYLVTAEGAEVMHRKRRLVPFVERMPRWLPRSIVAGAGAAPFYGGLVPGPPVTPMFIDSTSAGVLICYESAFGSLARRHRANGAQILLNITNDAWFSTGGGFATVGLWQHALHLRMRAIETRVGIVRAANRGFTQFVDPLGGIHDAVPRATPAATMGVVLTTDVITLYVRWGDWLATGAAIVALLLLASASDGRISPLRRVRNAERAVPANTM